LRPQTKPLECIVTRHHPINEKGAILAFGDVGLFALDVGQVAHDCFERGDIHGSFEGYANHAIHFLALPHCLVERR
jgi:hypothetical protein